MRLERSVVPVLAFALGAVVPCVAQPIGTAFTYQGRLTDAATPAVGVFDFQLVLFDAASGGSQVGPILTPNDVTVSQGLFTVTPDFGPVFAGNRRWLEIGVRPGASTGAYAILSPRQELTATPAALFSTSTPWTGVTAKPAGFADDLDNDTLGGLLCAPNQVPKRIGTLWFCGTDTDTTYTAGAGLSLAGTVFGIATGGVTTGMIQDGAVGPNALATDAVTRIKIAADAIGPAEIENGAIGTADIANGAVTRALIAANAVGTNEIANGEIGVADLNLAESDARYLNATEELTGTNYGGCGTYTILSCASFVGGSSGPACNQIPVGGICRVIGAAVCAGTAGGVCGDGSTWYLKITP